MGNYDKSEFEDELKVMLKEKRDVGEDLTIIVSNDLHKRVFSPLRGSDWRMPMACNAMKKLWIEQGSHDDWVIEKSKTDKWHTSKLKVKFRTSI